MLEGETYSLGQAICISRGARPPACSRKEAPSKSSHGFLRTQSAVQHPFPGAGVDTNPTSQAERGTLSAWC